MRDKKKKLLTFLLVFFMNVFFLPLSPAIAQNDANPSTMESTANKTENSNSTASQNSSNQGSDGSSKAIKSNSDVLSDNALPPPKNSSNKYSAPVDEKKLEVKAVAPEKRKEEKKVAQNSSVSSTQSNESSNVQNVQKAPVEAPPVKKSSDSSTTNSKARNDSEKYEPEFKNENQTPEDLPDVDAQEINLPQVVAKQDDTKFSTNILFVIAAWALIALGVLIVIFVILNSKRRRDGVHTKGKKSKLLSGGFYKK